jgi:hypothetical protein
MRIFMPHKEEGISRFALYAHPDRCSLSIVRRGGRTRGSAQVHGSPGGR